MAGRGTPEPGDWASHPLQAPRPDARVLGRWSPVRAADVTARRLQLASVLHVGMRPSAAAEAAVERLLLVFEELVSNAVRHGGAPIEVMVSATGQSWILEVTDAAGSAPPIPDPGRDAALGGLGLALVAKLSSSHGWEPRGEGRKAVWAQVDYARDEAATT